MIPRLSHIILLSPTLGFEEIVLNKALVLLAILTRFFSRVVEVDLTFPLYWLWYCKTVVSVLERGIGSCRRLFFLEILTDSSRSISVLSSPVTLQIGLTEI